MDGHGMLREVILILCEMQKRWNNMVQNLKDVQKVQHL